jgi:hypothetical protein
MVELRDVQTGLVAARITEAQLAFLVEQLEEEGEYDRDYYVDAGTLDLLAARGADDELLDALRGALGRRACVELEWSRRG